MPKRASWDVQDLRIVQDVVQQAFKDLGTEGDRQTALGCDFLGWSLDADGKTPPDSDSPSGLPIVYGSIGLLDTTEKADMGRDEPPARTPEFAFELTSQGPLTLDVREAIMDVVEVGLDALPVGYQADFNTYHPPTGQPVKIEGHAGYYAVVCRLQIDISP
jgi:hypothetical protein